MVERQRPPSFKATPATPPGMPWPMIRLIHGPLPFTGEHRKPPVAAAGLAVARASRAAGRA